MDAPVASVVMVDQEGRAFEAPPEEVAQNQQAGLRVVDDPAELAALKAKAFGSDHPVLAGAAGAVDGLTFGAVPKLLTETGAVKPETLKGLAEGSPTAYGGFKVAGALAPLIATDGAASALEGAGATKSALALKALAAPAKLVTRAGEAAEGLAGAGTAGTLARGATESALYGAGDALSESAIDNKPLTGELLLSHMGPAALFGGVGGVALEKGLGLAERTLPSALDKASGVLEKVSTRLEELGPGAATARADSALQAAVPKIEQAAEEAHGLRRDTVDALLSDKPPVPQASEVLGKLKAASEALPTDSAGQAVLDRVTERLEGKLAGAKSAAEQMQALEKAEATLATQEVLTPARAQLREVMGSEQLWGKAGAVQSAFGQRLDALTAARAEVAPLLKGGGLKRAVAAATEGDTAGIDALKNYVGQAQGLVDHATELAKDLPTGRRNITQIGTALDAVKGAAGEAVSKATPSGAEHVLDAVGGLLPPHLEAMAKAVVAPSRQAEVVAHIIGKAGQVTGRIARLAKEALSGASGKSGQATSTALRLADVHFGTEGATGESRAAGVARHAQDHATLANMPMAQLAERLTDSTPTLGRNAPGVAVALQQAGVRGQQVIAAAAPKNPLQSTGLPGEPKFVPSEVAQAHYERIVRAVHQPLSLLEDMGRGRLTAASVAAVAAAYPALYQHMTEQVTQALAERTERVPYSQRLQLSVFLGKPIDGSLRILTQLQANLAPPAPAAGGAPAASPGGSRLARSTIVKAGARTGTPLSGSTP